MSKIKYKKIYEDDTYLVIPEKYKKMSLEEIEEEEKEKMLKELKSKKSPTTLLTNSSKYGI